MKCEKCNAEMITFIEESTQGVRCPNCGWSIITTYIEEIRADSTIYSIYISHVTNIKTSQIRIVAKKANVNFMKAKDMLLSDDVKLCEEKAPKIKKIIEYLDKEKIPYKVIPDFKY
ncbi:MAG: hypothetical protein JEZ00_21630 [Anaerolineaceae bacterium]|nr:hypothetical protein [Anaerolineaceae bacterium]